MTTAAATEARKPTTVVRGASLLIALQIVSRAITFIANQLLLRFLTAELLGVSTQLEVFYLSVLFFSRESLRVAAQRTDTSKNTKGQNDMKLDSTEGNDSPTPNNDIQTAQSAINTSYLSPLIGLPLTILFGSTYISSLSPVLISNTPYIVPSLYIYALASLIELASEPAFIILSIRLRFATRGRAESLGTFARCLLTLGMAYWGSTQENDLGVLPFAVGQLGYGTLVFSVYTADALALAKEEGFSLLPRILGGKEGEFILGLFSRPTLNLARSMVVQSLVKYVLTQGDTLLVSILSTPEAVGVYALVSNYGGLLARLVFQPVEESSRSYFSRLLSGAGSGAGEQRAGEGAREGEQEERTTTDDDDTREKGTGKEGKKKPKEETVEENPTLTAHATLMTILHVYTFFSLPIVALGPSAASPLLSTVAGRRWTSQTSSTSPDAGAALASYTLTLPLLALNGILEAFVSSVASSSEVHAQSLFMIFFAFLFSATGYLCLGGYWDMGAEGLVAANSVNMLGRILWSGWFIRKWFGTRGVGRGGSWGGFGASMPSQLAAASAVVAAGVVSRVAQEGDGAMLSLLKVAGCAVPFGAVL
ncbi:uncharacterized protein MKZ38_010257 [Zalerion maritima]|uniref:Man(5)GlcNAc(2)-PP-dolichol translocation protein RFT1 n=1 Tax=Zalerion maritima TaxID=339359 RepID=A0AAD5RSI8_9PEZI|nr:uncharacterized protein MKZ38_010257 [Zalerion maritima]